jgi:Trypsin-co-occurring domain 1
VPEMIEFELAGGRAVAVEVPAASLPAATMPAGPVERVGRAADAAHAVRRTFDDALTDVREAASAALAKFRAMPSSPDEVEISFGVKFDARAGAVIAETKVAAHFEVTVRWAREGVDPHRDRRPGPPVE